MKNTSTNLPIFPLPVFLLPNGITRLRIFEQRYLKMVKIASKGQGFVIWLNSKELKKPAIHWGSWVEIINFNQGKDGVLEIDVKCKSLVDILSINKDEDNLHFGEIIPIKHWSQKNINALENSLSESLNKAHTNDPMLNELYSNTQSQNTNWVIARWLEILPINLSVKSSFVDVHNIEAAKVFVESIISNDDIN